MALTITVLEVKINMLMATYFHPVMGLTLPPSG
jgi:hypothetical protein